MCQRGTVAIAECTGHDDEGGTASLFFPGDFYHLSEDTVSMLHRMNDDRLLFKKTNFLESAEKR